MNSRFLLAPFVLALLFADASSAYAQAEKELGVKEAMRKKVAYSQQVLVGITLGDYGLIANNAQKLVELSNKTNWYSRQVPGIRTIPQRISPQRPGVDESRPAEESGRRIACLQPDDIELHKLS